MQIILCETVDDLLFALYDVKPESRVSAGAIVGPLITAANWILRGASFAAKMAELSGTFFFLSNLFFFSFFLII